MLNVSEALEFSVSPSNVRSYGSREKKSLAVGLWWMMLSPWIHTIVNTGNMFFVEHQNIFQQRIQMSLAALPMATLQMLLMQWTTARLSHQKWTYWLLNSSPQWWLPPILEESPKKRDLSVYFSNLSSGHLWAHQALQSYVLSPTTSGTSPCICKCEPKIQWDHQNDTP